MSGALPPGLSGPPGGGPPVPKGGVLLAFDQRKKAPPAAALDKQHVALARQLLDFLQKGYSENLYPDFIRPYRAQGLQDDLSIAYHQLALAGSRGFVLGMKAAEGAIHATAAECKEALARVSADPKAKPHEADQMADRAKGAHMALMRLRAVLDRQNVPGV